MASTLELLQIINGKGEGIKTYTKTPIWAGSADPTGTPTKEYWLFCLGPLVILSISVLFPNVGTANTSCTLPFPDDAPNPANYVGLGGSTGHHLYGGFGYADGGVSGGLPASRCSLNKNSTNDGYVITINFASQNARWAQGTVIYSRT